MLNNCTPRSISIAASASFSPPRLLYPLLVNLKCQRQKKRAREGCWPRRCRLALERLGRGHHGVNDRNSASRRRTVQGCETKSRGSNTFIRCDLLCVLYFLPVFDRSDGFLLEKREGFLFNLGSVRPFAVKLWLESEEKKRRRMRSAMFH